MTQLEFFAGMILTLLALFALTSPWFWRVLGGLILIVAAAWVLRRKGAGDTWRRGQR